MTLEQQKQIEREFQDAKTPEEVTKAQTHAILALVDCQRKTGERVTAALDEKRAEYVEKRDKAALPSTKVLYQAFIDAIDRIKERLAIEGD